jgi:hypothetical protein
MAMTGRQLAELLLQHPDAEVIVDAADWLELVDLTGDALPPNRDYCAAVLFRDGRWVIEQW